MQDRIMDQRGFTLLEVLVAMTILTIGLLGIAAMMITAINANGQSRRMTIATNLAQQRIEEMRNIPFENLFKTDPSNSNKSSNLAPVDMFVGTTISATNNGSNPCNNDPPNSGSSYPCGDVSAGDLIWTYVPSNTFIIGGTTFDRTNWRIIWTVQRNPDINGNGSLDNNTGNNTDADEQRTMRVEAIVSWKDATGRWHRVTTSSIISVG